MQSNGARAGLLVVLAAAAVVLFIVLSGGDDDSGGDETTTAADEPTATATVPGPTPFGININGGEPVGGPQELEVIKGDPVRILVTSDTAGEVHVHGYELEQEIAAGGRTTFRFTADIDGKFEIELHAADGAHAQLAELTVRPG